MSAFDNLTPLSFGTILADPPWYFKNRSAKGEKKNPVSHYACMELPDIQALPVSQLCRPDAVCLMWATFPMLPEALATMKSWGFAYKSGGAWAKQSSTGHKWAFGPGYCFRSAAEIFLLGTIGKPEYRSKSIRNLIVAPTREHSRKPDEMRRNIEAQFYGPYLELFARESAPGWTAWGNETDKFAPVGGSL
jgi:N6-adenosine-specific RNA methylase IME4